jgi:hypothetical protein
MMRLLRFSFAVLIVLFALVAFAVWDMHRLGRDGGWDSFQVVRARVYLITGSVLAGLLPPVGPLALLNKFSTHAFYFATHRLPNISAMDPLRELLLHSGDPGETLCARLNDHEKKTRFSGKRVLETRFNQRVWFSERWLPLFDDWSIVVRTTISNGSYATSFLVWGMGVVPDERAPEFFGRQIGPWAKLVPLAWTNYLEIEGVAKGYWVLLTETNQTSAFSYEARHKSPRTRIAAWRKIVDRQHKEGKGLPSNAYCGAR